MITMRGNNSGGQFSILYHYDNNDILSESDSQLRNVTLRITSNTSSITVLFIDLVFNDTEIDWLLLSEVDICEGA